MSRSAFVVSWDEDDAIHLASVLSEAGWLVALEHADGGKAWKRIKEGKPDVVVVDMRRRPSHSRELLRVMGQRKYTSAIPIVSKTIRRCTYSKSASANRTQLAT